ncbi:MAG: NADPH-dependent oxidoreductase [Bacteroidota bacterium]|nr:NADPH-dependent oxidoreductase [Bacteroidota bacterium]
MIDTILNHRSIRQYKDKKIEDNKLQDILMAASKASTTGNMQVYSIVVSKDEEIRKKLWEVHFKQDMVKQAPIVLTFCADFNRFNKWCEQRNTKPGYDNYLSFFTAAIDALLSAQNACLAAEEHGLGICYLGTTTYMADKIVDILKLPKGVVPITTVVVGYPNEKPGLTDRLPLEAIVHEDTYHDFSSDDIEKLYKEKEAMQEYIDIVKENEVENLAQVFAEKRYVKKDNMFFSKQFLKVIEEQGFMNNE